MLYALFDSLNIVQFVCHCHNVTQMLKSSHWNANLQLSCIKVILCRRSADRLDRLLLAIKPVVENRHSTGTDAAEVDRCNFASWHRCGYMPSCSLFRQKSSKSSVGTRFRLAVFFRLIFGWQKFSGWARYRLRLGSLYDILSL